VIRSTVDLNGRFKGDFNMKSKMIIGSLLMLGILFVSVGCGGGNSVGTPTPTEEPIGPQPIPTESLSQPPMNVSWISPGHVDVGNFYAGATAEYPIRVHNGNSVPSIFLVTCRMPDNTVIDYAMASPEAIHWVTITGAETPLEAYETRDMLVSLTMPYGAVAPASKWELWISVIDTSQTGFVQTEICTRWLITME